jgi:hypothetical protein
VQVLYCVLIDNTTVGTAGQHSRAHPKNSLSLVK